MKVCQLNQAVVCEPVQQVDGGGLAEFWAQLGIIGWFKGFADDEGMFARIMAMARAADSCLVPGFS